MRILRNLCIHGPEVQREITSNLEFQSFLFELLFPKESEKFTEQLQTTGWQLLANMMVNHQLSRELWARYGDQILQYLNADCKLSKSVNVKLMIVYNVMKRSAELIDLLLVMKAILFVWHNIIEQRCSEQFEFLHFIFEEFLVNNGRSTVKCYSRLSTSERLLFLNYLNNYIQQDSPNGLVHSFVMQHVSKEFNIKSDSILRVAKMQEVDEMKPQEAYALLRCIASASGSESYAEIYFKDHSLFLNVSSLLRCLVATTKNGQNVLFSPMNKLEEVAPSSSIPAGYQSEISFELKTLLVRCIANLLYNNDTNKMYCLDTELLPALFECTNMDARNPCELIYLRNILLLSIYTYIIINSNINHSDEGMEHFSYSKCMCWVPRNSASCGWFV